VGLFIDDRFLYLYALILGVSFPLQSLFNSYFWLPLMLSGVLITGIGVWLLTRFLKEFPAVAMDDSEEVSHD